MPSDPHASPGQPAPPDQSGARSRIEYHRDGSTRARGQDVDGVLEGYWEWFRVDETLLRSGHLADGEQVGEKTT
ncbi:MAG: hypothetical protein H7269_04525 [Cellulomonas sp.]|nr:hypothetical protein [Cellulomonas sp.]